MSWILNRGARAKVIDSQSLREAVHTEATGVLNHSGTAGNKGYFRMPGQVLLD
ncbi:MAG: hypothetical protein NTZ51_01915 [Proteobacteria bacterium]|nr:hypothetical protein [Pseudomonadota bacterium]